MAKSHSLSTISGASGADEKKLGTSPKRPATSRWNAGFCRRTVRLSNRSLARARRWWRQRITQHTRSGLLDRGLRPRLPGAWKFVSPCPSEGGKGQAGDPQSDQNKRKEKSWREHRKQQEIPDVLSDSGGGSDAGLPLHDLAGRRIILSNSERRPSRLRPGLNQHEGRHDQPNGGNKGPRAEQPTGPGDAHRGQPDWRSLWPTVARWK